MKRVEMASQNEKSNYRLVKIILLLMLFISVFSVSYMFGLKIVNDNQSNQKGEESINTLLERAKPK